MSPRCLSSHLAKPLPHTPVPRAAHMAETEATVAAVAAELMRLLIPDPCVCFPASHTQTALDERASFWGSCVGGACQHLAPMPSCLGTFLSPHTVL